MNHKKCKTEFYGILCILQENLRLEKENAILSKQLSESEKLITSLQTEMDGLDELRRRLFDLEAATDREEIPRLVAKVS